ncbi:MAG TPA: ribosome-associated translation inhibitor RaiA [Anaerolineae bacterium]|nr:ribosome-associated translation inhibitor RaiA [Anaerolineae bacterium]MCB0176750.1 ribosome-associated translation inhibitor RaiA [Anaerolineae bacterium]MCB0225480.1 ribosome-associated translation inhibitor RaiA [Anaerolineae bacterium]MCB9106923.1 ribosome-associated translation inhibitor RaiA [Anaerolineales bacterium]HRV92023.1 ribosome-associated translation inhibitor RaiA [Anaerolineae bacterium]
MQLELTGKNFVVSDRVRDYVEKKVGKLDRYLDVSEARVEISQEKTKSAKDRNVVQITLRTDGAILRAEDRSQAIYGSIDAVVDKIHRQIVRYKGKRDDRRQGHIKNQRDDMDFIPDELPELEPSVIESIADEQHREIVRVKRFFMNPMTEAEAVEQMELLGHNFFVFYNANLGRVNVIYRREDDNYGLLDPELA